MSLCIHIYDIYLLLSLLNVQFSALNTNHIQSFSHVAEQTNKQIISETSAKIFGFSQFKADLSFSLSLSHSQSLSLLHTHAYAHTQGCWLKLILTLIFQVTEYLSIASCYFSLIKNSFLCSNIASVFSNMYVFDLVRVQQQRPGNMNVVLMECVCENLG